MGEALTIIRAPRWAFIVLLTSMSPIVPAYLGLLCLAWMRRQVLVFVFVPFFVALMLAVAVLIRRIIQPPELRLEPDGLRLLIGRDQWFWPWSMITGFSIFLCRSPYVRFSYRTDDRPKPRIQKLNFPFLVPCRELLIILDTAWRDASGKKTTELAR
jgi:hypothetical protein